VALYAGIGALGLPYAAVVLNDTTDSAVWGVSATHYGAAVFDSGSTGLRMYDVSSVYGEYSVVLNGTSDSDLDHLSSSHDGIGLVLQGALGANQNFVTGSVFLDDTSYGVEILNGHGDTFAGNWFLGNNGATGVYSSAHIQAWSTDGNNFDVCFNAECTRGYGNYWADWHQYGPNHRLRPYLISGTVEDLFPI
jgi:Periplasmic copper-binding protein (NosD)